MRMMQLQGLVKTAFAKVIAVCPDITPPLRGILLPCVVDVVEVNVVGVIGSSGMGRIVDRVVVRRFLVMRRYRNVV